MESSTGGESRRLIYHFPGDRALSQFCLDYYKQTLWLPILCDSTPSSLRNVQKWFIYSFHFFFHCPLYKQCLRWTRLFWRGHLFSWSFVYIRREADQQGNNQKKSVSQNRTQVISLKSLTNWKELMDFPWCSSNSPISYKLLGRNAEMFIFRGK